MVGAVSIRRRWSLSSLCNGIGICLGEGAECQSRYIDCGVRIPSIAAVASDQRRLENDIRIACLPGAGTLAIVKRGSANLRKPSKAVSAHIP